VVRELGVNLIRLSPGEPIGMYHWAYEGEDFLLLAGEALPARRGGRAPAPAVGLRPLPAQRYREGWLPSLRA
jgi:hypothetical protein